MKNATGKKNLDQQPEKNNEMHTSLFDPELYETHKKTIAFVMGNFFLRHILSLYKEFGGDLIMPIVLGEIGHHNTTNFYSRQEKCIAVKKQMEKDPNTVNRFEPTNAYSLSLSTGIPRETVRRKIDKLAKKGWIVKNENGDLTISDAVSDYFTGDFNKRTLTELLEASECLRQILDPAKKSK